MVRKGSIQFFIQKHLAVVVNIASNLRCGNTLFLIGCRAKTLFLIGRLGKTLFLIGCLGKTLFLNGCRAKNIVFDWPSW